MDPGDLRFESGLIPGSDDLKNFLVLTLLVKGKEGELVEAAGFTWEVQDSIQETPERSRMWAGLSVELLQWTVITSKPRQAIRDATLAFSPEPVLLRFDGKIKPFSLDSLRRKG